MPAILNYLLHLATATALVLAFFLIYTKTTPYDEVLRVRGGNHAAALSLGGTLLGFSVTLASALLHTTSYIDFFAWSALAMVVQVLVFQVTTRLMKMSKDQIIIVNLSGRGDKDVAEAARHIFGENLKF